jgi:hypothetical protein
MVTSGWQTSFTHRYERFRTEANHLVRVRKGRDVTVIMAALKRLAHRYGMTSVVPEDALRDGAQRISKGEHPGF